jgi:hypothetical protein
MGGPQTAASTAARRCSDLKWTWTDAVAIAGVVLGVSFALRGYWQPGKPIEADFVIGVFRAYSLDQAWQARQFYPRLGMNLIFGYGSPLLQYYPPLASYLTLVWHWLGLNWVAATKAAFGLALLLAALGAYVYARWLFVDRRAALIAGLAYGLAPYSLFCIYERGSSRGDRFARVASVGVLEHASPSARGRPALDLAIRSPGGLVDSCTQHHGFVRPPPTAGLSGPGSME